jgi:hypothetical chaperone protein
VTPLASADAPCLGLDFGTSNSVAAVWHDGRVQPVIFEDGAAVQRTLFFLPDDDSIDGGPPILMGNAAAQAYFKNQVLGRMIQSVKSHLASRLDELTLSGIRIRIEELVALFLREIRRASAAFVGLPVETLDRVVLGRPVRFHLEPEADARAEARLLTAARLAGFKAVAFQYEPVAAALDYERRTEREELVLVGDLGGGTSDFAVVRVGPGRGLHDRARDVVATSGVPLAGNALDQDVMRGHVLDHFGGSATERMVADGREEVPWRPHILQSIVELPRIPLLRTRRNDDYLRRVEPRVTPRIVVTRIHDLIFRGLGFSLADTIEAAKIALSNEASTRIRFAAASIDVDTQIDQAGYAATTRATVDRITAALDEVLAHAGVAPGAISRVFLTGGTSQVPAILEEFDARFGADRIVAGDVFTSVAYGLARSWPLAAEPAAEERVVANAQAAARRAAPTGRVSIEPLRTPTVALIPRATAWCRSQPLDQLTGAAVAYLFALAEALPEPLRGELGVWVADTTRQLRTLPNDDAFTLLLSELHALPAADVPTGLREALLARAAEDDALSADLREAWDGVPPTPIHVLMTPADRATADKPPAARAAPRARSTFDADKPKVDDARRAAIRACVLERLQGARQGLKEQILIDSVLQEPLAGPPPQPDEVKRVLKELQRDKKIKVSGGRLVVT